MTWSTGDWVVRREVLSRGPWLGSLVRIVEDSPKQLVSFTPTGSPLEFPEGDWPTPDGRHPWFGRTHWQGHGCLMLQRPGDSYAVWHFWHGPDRRFVCWYINLQLPFRRTEIGYDTQDLELDFVVYPDGRWHTKDADRIDQRVAEGRWTAEEAEGIRRIGREVAERLESGERWWPLQWRDWQPDPMWEVPTALPPGWHRV